MPRSDVLTQSIRIEHDTMGAVRVPATAYYGAQTQRALENFQISGLVFPRKFIRALGIVKKASAEVNVRLGLLDERKGRGIAQAAQEVMDGKLDDQFVLDVFQTGSGTSTKHSSIDRIRSCCADREEGARAEQNYPRPDDRGRNPAKRSG